MISICIIYSCIFTLYGFVQYEAKLLKMTSELRHTDYTFCKPKCVNLIPFTFCEEFPKWIFPCPQPVNLMAINHSFTQIMMLPRRMLLYLRIIFNGLLCITWLLKKHVFVRRLSFCLAYWLSNQEL